MDFLDALRERPLVADGAMGTMIYSKGVGFEHNFELLNLTHPSSSSGNSRGCVQEHRSGSCSPVGCGSPAPQLICAHMGLKLLRCHRVASPWWSLCCR